MPIALLKFPSDLLGEVFKLCNPLELYCLSKCSKRVRKSITWRGPRNWKIRHGKSKTTWVRCGEDQYVFKHTINPDEYYKTSLWPYSAIFSNIQPLSMFVDIAERGDLFNYLLDTFKITIVELLDNCDEDIEFLRQTSSIAIDKNMEVEQVNLYDLKNPRGRDAVDFMSVMNQLKITQSFYCCIEFPSNFQHQFTTYPNEICVLNSTWFKIGQLLNCTCVKIELIGSVLRNQDFDVFFKKWKKTGTYPNLRWLKIASKKIDNQSTILEIVPPITNANNPLIEASFGYNDSFEISKAVRITKDDGTEGWLKVELGNWPKLKFLVVKPESVNVTNT
ncbi:hypothetical protein B9Z55_003130 [Caenorhabditis nigoni]|uniref:F-box domain-containing protein n=1 Tax=Caenorhabditis nigoni TaxID=1611254 RepID=A0A2G5VP20_9PELO|nr:hypothetical protein B9Z55_003130 [Caenorhabditis nigoni]